MENRSVDPVEAHRIFVLIWGLLLGSQVLFVGMVWFIRPELFELSFTESPFGEQPLYIIGAAAIGIHNLVMSFVQRRKLLARAVGKQSIGEVQTAVIASITLSESVSLFGMFVALAFDYPYWWIFFVAGIGATILHYPRRQIVDDVSVKRI